MVEQSYANHVKWVPTFHFFVMPVLVLNLVESLLKLFRQGFSFDRLVGALTAAALVLLMFHARLFALKVQDRVIRLEERLRMERLLAPDLQAQIGDFTPGQLVALRFASDAELPGLARKVITDNLTTGKAIKQMVKNWRADQLRA
jgi:hypothetical protein